MKISFKSQPDNLEKHVNQLMRENYAKIEKDIVNDCINKIDSRYNDEFNYNLRRVEFSPSDKDLVWILASLKEAYQQSGLNKDVECIDNQIKKLDVQA
mgnify:FL=1